MCAPASTTCCKCAVAKGISSAKARGYEIRGQSSVEPSEAKRREEKRSEANKSEQVTSNQRLSSAAKDEPVTSDQRLLGSILANSSPFSPRCASPDIRAAEGTSAGDLIRLQIQFYDSLCGIFRKRTPADTSSLHNLSNWIKERNCRRPL